MRQEFRFFRRLLFSAVSRLVDQARYPFAEPARAQRHVYLHPREIDPAELRLQLPLLESFIQYYNVEGNRAKLADVLHSFRFTSIAEQLSFLRQ